MSATALTALVTGGAKRVGRAIVEDLAAHGFAVAIHANTSLDDAVALARAINGNGGRAEAFAADLTDMAATGSLIGKVCDSLGTPFILVNNASAFEPDKVTEPDWAAWDRHFAVHVKAPALLARCFTAALPQGNPGLIVNMIDQRVWRPTPLYYSYTLSKATLWMATQTMAQALAPHIRVNAIGPGPTLKGKRQQDDDFRKQVDAVLLRHGPSLPEFGATIRYLWETPSITGQMIALDGGQHLAWQTPDVTGIVE